MDNLAPLHAIEGFPIGKDEDLHALSNPPYYTAYPNPHIADFIKKYGKPYDEATDDYHREPFVADISVGKGDPIYNAHSYHTKVPYKAVVPFVEHYTQHSEIVFDGFCGTGMIGVAAQSVGRLAVLCDISPIATFIASNYNSPTDTKEFQRESKLVLNAVEKECGWMYETRSPSGQKGKINYTVWSDVFVCPYCHDNFIYWDVAVNIETNEVYENFQCPTCKALLKKSDLSYFLYNVYDSALGKNINIPKQVPVLISYSVGKKRLKKSPDNFDLQTIERIEKLEIPYWYPSYPMMFKGGEWGDTWRAGYHTGISNLHQFYSKRNLWILAAIFEKIKSKSPFFTFWFTSLQSRAHRLNRYMANHNRHVGPLSGTLYLSSTPVEINVLMIGEDKISSLVEASKNFTKKPEAFVTTQSATDLSQIPADTIDYIFTDPPFGDNLMYSELNFLLEGWLKVFTNTGQEAIINSSQHKGLYQYHELMTGAFAEMFRILKPGRWITVEFHNSRASVWNAIQTGLARSGFMVAQVTIMDKQKGTTKQLTYPSAVKNDLIINAYKPRTLFTQRLISQAGRGLEPDFVREHLRQLPIAVNAERSKEMLYSKFLAYYIQHGYQVAYNGEQFYRALAQWGLEERDGYWFADEAQAHEYEQRKVKTFGKKGVQDQAVLFISDERSSRLWIWNFLDEPRNFDEIYTAFVKALQTSEDEIPELKIMLEESFVRTNGHWKRPDQLTQAELEQKRLERLLHQFNEYLEAAKSGQKIKEVRREAVLAGFTECYRTGRFQDILTLGHKLDKRLLEESPDLFDFVDIAEAKVEG